MVVFAFIGWVPVHAIDFAQALDHTVNFNENLTKIMSISALLSPRINPIFYNMASKKLREAFKVRCSLFIIIKIYESINKEL